MMSQGLRLRPLIGIAMNLARDAAQVTAADLPVERGLRLSSHLIVHPVLFILSLLVHLCTIVGFPLLSSHPQ